ncbi:SAM-dependent methyltransferase [Saccharothrix sp. ALI-22-I]|uniref:class I SAM-dependent methyltransferase n=1 Tax=Saccharothrix sp. ALI-22-I TaxID=1933778 RepID=UPI00097C4431|nr:class I SAM-dependent methyltransferase [Saccharothrix sp. ALI-22-I]ONI92428.1 SAM-dependent methyltransferase [Saccharothrix sp. ALI-22-I]
MAAHSHNHARTHDGIDWSSRLNSLRQADELDAEAQRVVARRLVRSLPDKPTVLDVGSGAGGMSVALVEALSARGGGTVVLVDAVPELLDAATNAARSAATYETDTTTATVRVRPVLADLATERPVELAGPAELVWASNVVHHLPDQRAAVLGLIEAVAPGGWLALAEGGLEGKFLPFDLGIGEPGLQDRLAAARAQWFLRMRENTDGSVRMHGGWNVVLADAGLVDVTAFTYLIDHPAPPKQAVRDWAVNRLKWLADVAGDLLHPADRRTVEQLLDPQDPAFLGLRDDVFLLIANTVHLGRKP